MKPRFALALAAAMVAVATLPAAASQLVYKPINPSFGGDPLNGSWMLSQGQSQSADAGGSGGFSIDFPDFGGIPQDDDGNNTNLPPVNGNNNNNSNSN